MERQELIKKIEQLPPDRLAEVEKLVASITRGERELDRKSLHEALAHYASKHAETPSDLDEELEAATIKDAIEEIALSRAIDEGLETKPITRDEILPNLQTASH